MLKDGHQVYTTSKDKAEQFCQTFATKCQLASTEESAPDVHHSATCSMEKIAFKIKDVRKLLRNLQSDKATGPDEIPARVLEECSAELARPLSLLFEFCFSKGVFPANRRLHLSSLFTREIQSLIHLCTARSAPSLCSASSARSWRLLYRTNFRSISMETN